MSIINMPELFLKLWERLFCKHKFGQKGEEKTRKYFLYRTKSRFSKFREWNLDTTNSSVVLLVLMEKEFHSDNFLSLFHTVPLFLEYFF